MPSLLRELVGKTCRCGKAKRTRTSLCLKCYQSLPAALRNGLYQRFGSGYEQAYEAAAKHLDAQTKTTAVRS